MKLEQVVDAIQNVRMSNAQHGVNVNRLKLKIIMSSVNLYELTRKDSPHCHCIDYKSDGPVEIMGYPVTVDNSMEGFEIVKIEWVGE